MRDMRTNVVLPADLLAAIDRVAGPRHRSRFLVDAAREKLDRLRFEQAAASAFGCWTDENHPELRADADLDAFFGRLRDSADRRLAQRWRHE